MPMARRYSAPKQLFTTHVAYSKCMGMVGKGTLPLFATLFAVFIIALTLSETFTNIF
jgi:hypothetical protein